MLHDWVFRGNTSYGPDEDCARCGVNSFMLSAMGPCRPKVNP